MKKNLWISLLMTMATTVLFGLVYPLVVTALAQLIFPHKANGELIVKNGKVVGSSIIGQGFSGPGYFHPRPSGRWKRIRCGKLSRIEPRPNQSEALRSRKERCGGRGSRQSQHAGSG